MPRRPGEAALMVASNRRRGWKYVRGLTPPVLVFALLVGWLAYALLARVQVWQDADEFNLREWLNEARVFRKTLPELVREYLDTGDVKKGEEIKEQLRALGDPTRMYTGQLPLFPEIYRLEVYFPEPAGPSPIVWDCEAPRAPRSYRVLDYRMLGERDGRAMLHVEYELDAYNKTAPDEQQRPETVLVVGLSECGR